MRFLLSLVLCLAFNGFILAAEAAKSRPETWAKPVEMDGAPNLHRVSDSLFRSAQPSGVGMRNLETAGIKTIVNLRSFNSDRKELRGTALRYEHIYVKAWHPERKEVVEFLRIVADPKKTPVLVHCQHGADRTGTMCAVYRIFIQGWSKEDALREMTEGGFGFHSVWKNLPAWINKLDVDAIRREAGLDKRAE